VVTNNPPLCLILAITSSKGGPLTKNPKNIFIKIFVFNSLKAISHRKERVKRFPMRINKLQRSDAKFIASHILKAPLKENPKESPTADMRRRISQRRISSTQRDQMKIAILRFAICDLRFCDLRSATMRLLIAAMRIAETTHRKVSSA
jgi:hypothetical protein